MTNIEFLTGICQKVLNPLPPITEEEKLEVLDREATMEAEAKEDPPYDIALEL